jgi:hypothetical protein
MPTIQELDTTVRAFYEGRGEQVEEIPYPFSFGEKFSDAI